MADRDDEIIIEGMLTRSTARELAEELVHRCACTFIDDAPTMECEYHAKLKEALVAIYQAARTDHKGEWWTAREYLNKRGVYNDDLSTLPRLIEAICSPLLPES